MKMVELICSKCAARADGSESFVGNLEDDKHIFCSFKCWHAATTVQQRVVTMELRLWV